MLGQTIPPYGVYITHVIMIGIFGTLLLNTSMLALVKYPILIISTYVGSNLLVSTYYAVRWRIASIRKSVTPQVESNLP